MIKAEQVLRYWLGSLNNELAKPSQVALWYQATPVIDQEISAQFFTRKLVCNKCKFLITETYNGFCLNCKLEKDGTN